MVIGHLLDGSRPFKIFSFGELLLIELTRNTLRYPLVFVWRINRKRTSLVSPVYFFTLADRVCSIILIVTSFMVAFKKASTCVIIIL